MKIVTKPNCISIDGKLYPKNSYTLKPSKDGVTLNSVNNQSDYIKVSVVGTTIDDSDVSDKDELMSFFEAQGFSDGGGAPVEGVQWDEVQDKPLYTLGTPIQDAEGLIPVYTQNGQLPVGIPEFPENAVPLILLDTRVPNGGTNGQVLKKNAEGGNIWATDANTTYSVITEAEFNTGTANTARTVSAVSLNRDIEAKVIEYLSSLDGYAPGATLTVNTEGDGFEWV